MSELEEMFFIALDHGYATIMENGGPLTPFAMVQRLNGDKSIHRFATETLESGLEEAQAFVDKERDSLAM